MTGRVSFPKGDNPRHAYKPSAEAESLRRHREADARFIRAMALAFRRGDHKPRAQP
jgi:hypothetical protein